MYYTDLPFYAQILWVLFGSMVILPWLAIPAIAIYKLVQVMKMPKVSTASANVGVDVLTGNLGFTMADGGEKVKNGKRN